MDMRLVGRIIAAVLILMSMALPAAGQDDQIVNALLDDGYYLEGRTQSEAQAVAEVIGGIEDSTLYLVELQVDIDPLGLADELLAEVGSGTVLVVTPFEIGWASDRYDDAAIETAVDRSLSAFDRSPAAGLEEFAAALPAPSASGGGLGWLIPVGVIAVVGGGIWLLVRRGRNEREKARASRLLEAKEELDGQVAVVANYIVELSDRVTVAENDEAEDLYRAATDTFAGVQDDLPGADELAEMEGLSDRLDEARWQLEATEAKLEGRSPPPKPVDRPAKCFFDPNHRAGTETAEITTPAGSQTVSVCRQCKARLGRGERVVPRDINVGGQPIPAPRAPRTHGGSGFDWLDAFQILVGGASVGYDIGRSRGRPARRRSSIPSLPRTGTRRSSRSSPTRSRRSTGRRARSGSRSRSRGSRSRGRRRR